MSKLAIAAISALALSSASAQALVVDRTYNFYIGGDFAYGPYQDLAVSLDRSLGRVVSIKYHFAATEEWYAPVITIGQPHGYPTVRMSFEGRIFDDTDYPFEWFGAFHTRLANVASRSPWSLDMRGWVWGSFHDDPDLYTNLLWNGLYGRTITISPWIDWNGNRVCSGPCDWYVDFSVDQEISFVGALTQSVDYAPFFVPEPSSLGLLILGGVAAGFAATRRLRSR